MRPRRGPGWRRALGLLLVCAAGPLAAQTSGASRTSPSGDPGPILSARFAGPTTRYPHGALGDPVEHETLVLDFAATTRHLTLDPVLVFEDEAPRLADLDGDGAPEVIVVESHRDLGARLAIWGPSGRLAATPFIGQRFRWLAPLGAADLDGDGRVELAWVDRPHLAHLLRIWRYDPAGPSLSEVATAPGVTNHRIGWEHIPGGLRDCGAGPEMILADADWRQVLALRLLPDGRVTRSVIGRYDGPESLDAARAACGG